MTPLERVVDKFKSSHPKAYDEWSAEPMPPNWEEFVQKIKKVNSATSNGCQINHGSYSHSLLDALFLGPEQPDQSVRFTLGLGATKYILEAHGLDVWESVRQEQPVLKAQ